MLVPHKRYAHQAAKEEDLWNGYPEETNAPYGLANLIAKLTGFDLKFQHKGVGAEFQTKRAA